VKALLNYLKYQINILIKLTII